MSDTSYTTTHKDLSVLVEQKQEDSRVANLHVQHQIICINLH